MARLKLRRGGKGFLEPVWQRCAKNREGKDTCDSVSPAFTQLPGDKGTPAGQREPSGAGASSLPGPGGGEGRGARGEDMRKRQAGDTAFETAVCVLPRVHTHTHTCTRLYPRKQAWGQRGLLGSPSHMHNTYIQRLCIYRLS